MSQRALPTIGGDTGIWAHKLNDYLRQLSPTTKGGINTWSTRPTEIYSFLSNSTETLGVAHEGLTGVNTATNVLERWNGTSWEILLNGNGTPTTPSGYTGEIQFNGNGSFAASNQLFWDNTNKRLGIGTNTPGDRLHVAGAILTDIPTNEGGRIRILNTSKTGATAAEWSIFNMTSAYGNGLSFWRYYANGTNAGAAMWLADDGNVGIGTTAPSQRLTVFNGTTIGTYTTSGWQHVSDKRLKDEVEPIDEALNKIKQIKGVYFKWKTNHEASRQVGFLAQEVKEIIPELVLGEEGDIKKGETLSMNYANLCTVSC